MPSERLFLFKQFFRMQRTAGVMTIAWCRFPASDTQWADVLSGVMVESRLIGEAEREEAREMLLEHVKDVSLLVDQDIVAVVNSDARQEDCLAERPRKSLWQGA